MSRLGYPDPRLASYTSNKSSFSVVGIVIMLTFLAVGAVAIYFLYNFLFSSSASRQLTTIASGEIIATKSAPTIGATPVPYEGGEYTLSFWLYVNSYNVNRNKRKHIIDIGGTNFSTVLIALGAFKNTLVVRTHSREAGTAVAGNDSGSKASNVTPSGATPTNGTGATATNGTGATATNGTGATATNGTGATNPFGVLESFQTPNSQSVQDGSLTTADKNTLLAPMALDDGLLNVNNMCDLNEIDFQRWTLVTVVLSGRTVDVYLDGKLARSCISSSYYKVDPTGIKVTMFANGGFDGYISNVKATNAGLNPSEIYTLYTKGPQG